MKLRTSIGMQQPPKPLTRYATGWPGAAMAMRNRPSSVSTVDFHAVGRRLFEARSARFDLPIRIHDSGDRSS